jgi:hypothetical protein
MVFYEYSVLHGEWRMDRFGGDQWHSDCDTEHTGDRHIYVGM